MDADVDVEHFCTASTPGKAPPTGFSFHGFQLAECRKRVVPRTSGFQAVCSSICGRARGAEALTDDADGFPEKGRA